ncbi:MAG: DUF349 domain-containing protein [Flavobacteriales bacterium]|nr:DUF349 domain-containing protein [Flavobacteriales bacterium]MBK7555425.1 DUF349 domain-containing protein [Flavobacteriales bacterium]MBK9196798.1 DUF349 domain-containing protein [Flavobacteriales bacterium]MBP6574771.1 DUF349 domain-containing protein [Flavobacteriales bacterium]
MASKQELIAKLEEILQRTDPEQAGEAVDHIKETYEALVAAEHAAAEAVQQADQESGDVPATTPAVAMENMAPQNEDDKRFKQLIDAFNTKVNDLHRKRQKEEADNLEAKKGVMDELRQLITQEENIGTAFHRFSELNDKWRSIGNVPQSAYRDLQTDYGHLRDEFFYHMRIYKELREHDLKKNTALKYALISDMEAVSRVDSVREAELLVKQYQEQWHQIGPVLKEEWESIRDKFWGATRVVYERIQEHYRARRAEQDANLQAKKDMVNRVLEISEQAKVAGAKEWKDLTDKVIEAQNAWKSIGFASKKDNDRIWKDFRDACNVFFGAKRDHYNKLKEQYKGVLDKKKALLDQALALKDSTDWKQAADKLKVLQQQWKEGGSAGPRDEHRLWLKFRETCDAFFAKRKERFAAQDAEQDANLKIKQELLAEIEAHTHSGNKSQDLEVLRAFSQRWMAIGRVHPSQHQQLWDKYKLLLDKHYGQLNVEQAERRQMQFKEHLTNLKSSNDGMFELDRESRLLKRKIEEKVTEVQQMERNMGMFNFKSAAGEAMRKEMEKNLERVKREVERMKAEHKQLVVEMRTPAVPEARPTT